MGSQVIRASWELAQAKLRPKFHNFGVGGPKLTSYSLASAVPENTMQSDNGGKQPILNNTYYLSYFSIAVTIHHDLANLLKTIFLKNAIVHDHHDRSMKLANM